MLLEVCCHASNAYITNDMTTHHFPYFITVSLRLVSRGLAMLQPASEIPLARRAIVSAVDATHLARNRTADAKRPVLVLSAVKPNGDTSTLGVLTLS